MKNIVNKERSRLDKNVENKEMQDVIARLIVSSDINIDNF